MRARMRDFILLITFAAVDVLHLFCVVFLTNMSCQHTF